MANKITGLGANFYCGGYNLSADVSALDNVSGGNKPLDVTAIQSLAHERLGGVREGILDFSLFFDIAAGGAHAALSGLPTADVVASAFIPPLAIGAPACSVNAKQVTYDWTRGTDGSLTGKVNCQSNAFGLEWGEALTAGLRTDTAATNGATQDDGTGTAFGAQAYLQVTAFTGTSVDIQIQHSTDNATWSSLIDFGAQSAIGAVRASVSNVTTVNRYLRAITGTGTFTSVTFAVMVCRNLVSGVVF